MTIDLTPLELDNLINLLVEESMRMDDDGNDGAFDASAYRPILNKLTSIKRAAVRAGGGA